MKKAALVELIAAIVLLASPTDAFSPNARVAARSVSAVCCFQPASPISRNAVGRRPLLSRSVVKNNRLLAMTAGLDELREKLKAIELEGIRMDLLNMCDKTQRGITSPPDSAERKAVLELVEKLEKLNRETKPLASDAINGKWVLRWTTSESILGRNRPPGFRVDLRRPILQYIDTKTLTARNVEPITTFRWIFGGIRYTNNVQAELTPTSDSKVTVQFKKFNLFGGRVSLNAPERARGELDTTYLDNGVMCTVDGRRGDAIRISRGDKGNVFVLSKADDGVIKEGDAVPDVVFKARVRDDKIGGDNPFTWKDIKSSDLFKGKRSVVFSLPGAFTPTCSSTHLPGYEEEYEAIKRCGIDDVYCLSVNDAFVMRQWGLHQKLAEEKADTSNPLNPGNFQKVKLLPDGACLFTRGMGMSCTWDTERGFGERSWRYAAVINDMKVEKLFVEGGGVQQNSGPDPFEVSDAKTMLNYLKLRS